MLFINLTTFTLNSFLASTSFCSIWFTIFEFTNFFNILSIFSSSKSFIFNSPDKNLSINIFLSVDSNISNCLDSIYREDGILISQNNAKVLPSGKVIDNGLLSFREMSDECYQRFLTGEGERVGEEQKKTPTK